MLKKIRIFLICTLTLSIIIWIAAFIITQKYLIRGFSLLYPLYGAVFSISCLFIIEIIKKVNLSRITRVVISSLIAFGAFICCFTILSVNDVFFGSGELYAVSVENLTAENEIYLHEYHHFNSNEGMLCVKKNDIFYLKLKETKYRVELNHTVSDPKNRILTYDKETGVLTMKYTHDKYGGYYENYTTYFCDK